jgi:hypothetical protein
MKNRNWTASLLLVFTILACNLPSAVTPTPTPTSALPSATPTASTTPVFTATPLPSATSTPTVPIAWPKDVPVNCRFGPGTDWEATGALLVGQTATLVGRNAASSWWYVQTPNEPGSPCWVAASVTNTAGNLSGLALIPAPAASVTQVTVAVEPDDIGLPPGCLGPVEPVEITGTIRVNGPLTVEYRFETEQSGEMSAQTIEFDGFGTETIEIDYSPPPDDGEFWVRLVIIEPGDEQAQAVYEIDC